MFPRKLETLHLVSNTNVFNLTCLTQNYVNLISQSPKYKEERVEELETGVG
jgi:hypothetical protein